MISLLKGTIEFKGDRFLVVNTGGVGYKVFLSPEVLRRVSEIGSEVKLWTHTVVREDALELYGFFHYAELEFFELLISVSGIGPKSAIGILGVASLDNLKKAISAGETAYLTSVSGIGRKMADKIIVELREKVGGTMGMAEGISSGLREEADVLEALTSMGYTIKEARDALGHVDSGVVGTNKRLQEALRILGSGRNK